MRYLFTSFATFERAWYKPIQTGIVAKVGKHPVHIDKLDVDVHQQHNNILSKWEYIK